MNTITSFTNTPSAVVSAESSSSSTSGLIIRLSASSASSTSSGLSQSNGQGGGISAGAIGGIVGGGLGGILILGAIIGLIYYRRKRPSRKIIPDSLEWAQATRNRENTISRGDGDMSSEPLGTPRGNYGELPSGRLQNA